MSCRKSERINKRRKKEKENEEKDRKERDEEITWGKRKK